MTQEEKQLLLIDLCARLPYKVMIKSVGENKIIGLWDLKDIDNLPHPYLRPMPYLHSTSSMTEEEKSDYDWFCSSHSLEEGLAKDFTDWLNAHHLDYRGLIPMGLALEAKEGMYGKI